MKDEFPAESDERTFHRGRGRPKAWDDRTAQNTIKSLDRAMAVFEKVGLPVTPFPVDFGSDDAPVDIFNWLPDAGALQQTTVVMRELIGRLVYRLKGWV